MKKRIYLLFATLILALSLIGCTNQEELGVRAYVYEESAETIKPILTFLEEDQFTFTYSALSSYYPTGTYEIVDEVVFLKTMDEKHEYVFRAGGENLLFDAEKSSDLPSFANLPDGAVFKLQP